MSPWPTQHLEEPCFMGCDVMWSGRGLRTCQKNVLPPSVGSKSRPSKQQAEWTVCRKRSLDDDGWGRSPDRWSTCSSLCLHGLLWNWRQYTPPNRHQTLKLLRITSHKAGSTLHSHHREGLKSNILNTVYFLQAYFSFIRVCHYLCKRFHSIWEKHTRFHVLYDTKN